MISEHAPRYIKVALWLLEKKTLCTIAEITTAFNISRGQVYSDLAFIKMKGEHIIFEEHYWRKGSNKYKSFQVLHVNNAFIEPFKDKSPPTKSCWEKLIQNTWSNIHLDFDNDYMKSKSS